ISGGLRHYDSYSRFTPSMGRMFLDILSCVQQNSNIQIVFYKKDCFIVWRGRNEKRQKNIDFNTNDGKVKITPEGCNAGWKLYIYGCGKTDTGAGTPGGHNSGKRTCIDAAPGRTSKVAAFKYSRI
ncbi:MAG: hypothetical protein LUH20_10495, partial [Lachnospiraceae bacterium]|nr:hypothetical protein [Lachnospiraceae bacterium]